MVHGNDDFSSIHPFLRSFFTHFFYFHDLPLVRSPKKISCTAIDSIGS